ncbi:MAG: hypothetical protein V4502_06370 [Pseudomonadota bacterium]
MRTADTAAIRDRGAEAPLLEVGSSTSRRALLGALAVAPLAALSTAEVGRFGMSVDVPSELVPLRRTREGRHLSRIRYHNAESFFAPVEQGFPFRPNDHLYQTGITLQLALSSHLLDVGFDDAWCAKNIGLYLNKSLEHANATGLGHDRSELKRLGDVLSPYGRLRNADVSTAFSPCPFSNEQICRLVRELLERVREVTGHNRPRDRRSSL